MSEGIGNEFEAWSGDDNGVHIPLTKSNQTTLTQLQINVKHVALKKACSTSSSQTYSSTARSSSNKPCRASRIVEEDFDPLPCQVAIAAKSHFRALTVFDNPFPPQGVGRFEYGWKAIKAMVNESGNKKWKTALTWTDDDLGHPQQLVKFVSYFILNTLALLIVHISGLLWSVWSFQ